jgi:hypothetical protein
VFSSDFSSQSGKAPSLFSSFSPYLDDTNGVSVASGFVDFSTGRYSIVTAPGAGSPAQVKIFAFPLMPAIGEKKKKKEGEGADQCDPGSKKPVVTNAFMPFGMDYRGGLSLATGWLTGPLGGAETIVTGQLAGPGEVKIYSSGSRLDGGPQTYLESADKMPVALFSEIASFRPFDGGAGVSVATTSTTMGGDLLVSGVAAGGTDAQVRKFQFVRAYPDAVRLDAKELGTVAVGAAGPSALGGD